MLHFQIPFTCILHASEASKRGMACSLEDKDNINILTPQGCRLGRTPTYIHLHGNPIFTVFHIMDADNSK